MFSCCRCAASLGCGLMFRVYIECPHVIRPFLVQILLCCACPFVKAAEPITIVGFVAETMPADRTSGCCKCGKCFEVVIFMCVLFWSVVCFAGVLGYWLGPVYNGKEPRWGGVALMLLSLLQSCKFALDVWMCLPSRRNTAVERAKMASGRAGLARWCFLMSLTALLFFLVCAPHLDACIHVMQHGTCEGDWHWALVNTAVAGAWWLYLKVKGRGSWRTENFEKAE